MMFPGRNAAKVLVTVACLIGLPLAGAWLAGKPVGMYVQFPPITGYVQHAPLNRLVFYCGVLFGLAVISLIFFLLLPALSQRRDRQQRRFPLWGLGGVVLSVTSWIVAWNRFPWFADLQEYTFFPLWLGFILSVNGVTCWLSGSCLITRNPIRFLLLFPISSLFWWYFEWLNRFVQNWYYVGIENFTATGYVLHATVCFGTVLPAVQATSELLVFFLDKEKIRGSSIRLFYGKKNGWALLVFMACILIALSWFPDFLFPFVWISPCLFFTGLQMINNKKTIFYPLFYGQWGPIVIPALAALVCGFFWEMWNWKSYVHWEYSIPYVDCCHIFKMPLLGYLGYLPFGMECFLIEKIFRKRIFL